MLDQDVKIDPINKKVGKNLRFYRQLNQLTQEQLGHEIGVPRSKIGQYERGTRAIPASTMLRLTTILKIAITDLYQGLGSQSDIENLPMRQQLPFLEENEILQMYRAIADFQNPEILKRFIAVLDRASELYKQKNNKLGIPRQARSC